MQHEGRHALSDAGPYPALLSSGLGLCSQGSQGFQVSVLFGTDVGGQGGRPQHQRGEQVNGNYRMNMKETGGAVPGKRAAVEEQEQRRRVDGDKQRRTR